MNRPRPDPVTVVLTQIPRRSYAYAMLISATTTAVHPQVSLRLRAAKRGTYLYLQHYIRRAAAIRANHSRQCRRTGELSDVPRAQELPQHVVITHPPADHSAIVYFILIVLRFRSSSSVPLHVLQYTLASSTFRPARSPWSNKR